MSDDWRPDMFSRPKTVLPDWLYDKWVEESKDEFEREAMRRHFVRASPPLEQQTLDAINDFWRNR